MQLNNLLASPGFAAWMEGEPLDVAAAAATRRRASRASSIFSIAHLTDAERMFFVSLLLERRCSAGCARSRARRSLRAILYMDEIFGYFPPVANPPSKRPLLTLLKQARAFGAGRRAGDAEPGRPRLQGAVERRHLVHRPAADRARQGARARRPRRRGGRSRRHVRPQRRWSRLIAGLGKRVFLMNNVHEDAPVVFETRWALSYLRGPLTRDADPDADGRPARPRPPRPAPAPARRAAAAAAAAAPPAAAAPAPAVAAPAVAPAAAAPMLPPDVPRYYIPLRGSPPAGASLHYVPMTIGSASVRIGAGASRRDAARAALRRRRDDDVGRRRRRRRRRRPISPPPPRARPPSARCRRRRARSARYGDVVEGSSPTGSTARRR